MKALRRFAVTFMCGFLLVVFSNSAVFAETVNCTAITSVPVTITTEGIYCLESHLTSAVPNVAAITVDADDVVIDLNGFTLAGLGGSGTQAAGISSAEGRTNITIKNGTVRGFLHGIRLSNADGNIMIEGIRAEQNTSAGIRVSVVGGSSSIIRNNQIVVTEGTTIFGENADATGIFLVSGTHRVVNNEVIRTEATGTGKASAIRLNGVVGSVVENNRLSNLSIPISGTGVDVDPAPVGGFDTPSRDLLVVNNRITGMTVGIRANSGTKFRDNLTIGVMTPFTGGGIDAGNNN